jgi:hypothetical protein
VPDKENWFESPAEEQPPTTGINHDPSIEHEPALQGGNFAPCESELNCEQVEHAASLADDDQRVDHSVWDEPSLARGLAGEAPADALTYASWLESRIASTSPLTCWLTTLGIVLAAGGWAIVGAIVLQMFAAQLPFGPVLMAPLTEEIMKLALATWVVEKRPFLFRSPTQILLCAMAGGLVFAAVENVLYLNVYIPNPSPEIITWRWTVCVALHAGCSLVGGFGLVQIWKRTMANLTRPELSHGAKWLIAAMVLHGIYNALAVVFSLSQDLH